MPTYTGYRAKLVPIFSILPFILGCTTLKNPSAEWPWKEKIKGADSYVCKAHPCDEKDAMNAYVDAHKFCRDVHNFYERRGNRSGISQFIVGTVGSLAGAVIAPISSGGAASAWSGLSGATNAMQSSMDEHLSGSISSKVIDAIRLAAEDGESNYSTALDYSAKVVASINMTTACAMAPSKAEKEAFHAINN
ncbi:MAG TPA: hypothetical protein PLR90_09745 [Methylophilus sp.]|nr:hypothetical protein [Methylophilus sp.]HQQ34186.1 hypothetical protein [Methylophilus sp.]